MAVCVISQPRFFPALHYLHRMMIADVFVILDTVKHNPRHEENRTRLKNAQGRFWLTVPIQKSTATLLRETRVDDRWPWRRKTQRTLDNLYGSAPHYAAHAKGIMDVLNTPSNSLLELDLASWQPALAGLGVRCRFVRASELPLQGRKSQLLLDICKHLGCDVYLSGPLGRGYVDAGAFAQEGVQVRFHDFKHPVYPQRFGTFIPFLGYVDMLFNHGLDREQLLSAGSMAPP